MTTSLNSHVDSQSNTENIIINRRYTHTHTHRVSKVVKLTRSNVSSHFSVT